MSRSANYKRLDISDYANNIYHQGHTNSGKNQQEI